MTNERDSVGTVKGAGQPIKLQTTGPFVAVTPNATAPDPRASAVFNAVMKKDVEARGQRGSGS